jgi:hypothetical protein
MHNAIGFRLWRVKDEGWLAQARVRGRACQLPIGQDPGPLAQARLCTILIDHHPPDCSLIVVHALLTVKNQRNFTELLSKNLIMLLDEILRVLCLYYEHRVHVEMRHEQIQEIQGFNYQ